MYFIKQPGVEQPGRSRGVLCEDVHNHLLGRLQLTKCEQQPAGQSALASEVKATPAGIFHELDTQEGQGQIYPVLWIKIATGGIPDGVSVSS